MMNGEVPQFKIRALNTLISATKCRDGSIKYELRLIIVKEDDREEWIERECLRLEADSLDRAIGLAKYAIKKADMVLNYRAKRNGGAV